MATLEDIVAATKILSEDPEKAMGASGSKPKDNRARVSGVRKDGVNEQLVNSETVVVESTVDGESGLNSAIDDREREKIGVKDLGCSENLLVNAVVDAGVSLDGPSDENRKDCEGLLANNGEIKYTLDEKEDLNDEESNNRENTFRVGDFVWVKITSHPWWPGRVYNPNDASEPAMNIKQDGRILVAFFGDGSCSWCSSSQLIPFVENFSEISKVSNSKSFTNAVKMAIDEIGRLVELKMSCKCIADEKKDFLVGKIMPHAGLKAGVITPEVNFHRLSIPSYESVELLKRLRDLAKAAVSVESVLEIAVLKSWLSAFYCFKGGYALPMYYEPLHIEGLEDKNENGKNDFSGPIEVPNVGPLEDDKVSHKRKQKSVAELMAEIEIKPEKHRERNIAKEGTYFKKQKRRESNNGELEGFNNQKRKVEKNVGPISEKPNEIEVSDGENNTCGDHTKEEIEIVSTPRERKKSKYLSPPYTDLTWRIGYSSFKMETKFEHDKKTEASGDLFASQPVSNSTDAEKLTFSVSDVDFPVNELLLEIQFAAVDPLYLNKKGSSDAVSVFISALRSSTYLHGENYKTYCKCKKGGKRKSAPSGQENVKKPESFNKAAENFAEKSAMEKADGTTWPCLIVTFTPQFLLPSKDDIVRLFGKFGKISSKKTKVMNDSHSIKIVYFKDSDAEAAFKSSSSGSPFGHGNANYKLVRVPRSRKSHQKVSSPAKCVSDERDSSCDLISDASVVRQKLEIMTAIIKNYGLKFTAEEKCGLKDDMKVLLEKVEMVSEKVRVMAEKTSA